MHASTAPEVFHFKSIVEMMRRFKFIRQSAPHQEAFVPFDAVQLLWNAEITNRWL